MIKNVYEILLKEIGYKIKEYREKWDISGNGEDILEYPLHLNLELVAGCNLRCPTCLHSLPENEWPYKIDRSKKIEFNKFRNIIDEGIKYGLCSIELNGVNEPFLCKEIIRYIKYVKKAGILQILLHTNGLLLTKELSFQIIRSGLTNISFSLDAINKETYNKVRVGGDYDKVIKNIEYFLYVKKKCNSIFPLTRVSLVRSKVNCNEISQFKEFWKEKVDIVSTSFFYNPFVGHKKYIEVEEEYRMEDNSNWICNEPYQRLFIFNNGDVAPCCSLFGGCMIVGNIYNDSLYDIWNGNKIKKIRKEIKNEKTLPEPCKKCRMGHIGGSIRK